MEDEGIMALPQGQEAMQNQDLPAITSMDSYDAATTALGRVNPEQLTAYKQAIREAIAGLELSPAEIETLLEIVEYMSQNPGEYPQLLRQLIDQDYIDEGDLPEQFDPVYLGVMLAALNELKLSRSEGATAPMQMAPEVEGLGPMPMAEGGLADMARLLAAQGRGGDTMLAHITPKEARLLKARGGAGTINPKTGLPEFFLGKLFKGIKKVFKAVGKAVKSALKNPIVRIIASVALATVLGPTGFAIMSAPAAAATASAATTLGAGGSLKEALISSATSYFGAGGTIGGVNPAAAVTSRVGQYLPGGATGAIAKGVGAGVTSAGIGLVAGMKPEEALRMGALQGLTTGATQAFQNWRAGQPQVEQPTQAQTQPVDRTLGELPPEDYVAPPPAGTTAQGPVTAPPSTAPAATQVGTGAPGAVGTATEVPATPSRPGFLSNFREGLSRDVPVDAATGLPVPAQTMAGRLGQAVAFPSLTTAADALLFNPYAQTELGKFAPAALTTLGIGALTGGFKSEPVNESPLFNRNYTGSDFIRDNPQLFAGTLGRLEGMPPAYNPVVPYSTYSQMQTAARPTTPTPVVPRTTPPAGVVPPANIAGRMSAEELAAYYGLPELASPVPQPVYMAEGGPVNDSTSADYWFDVFTRNNPGKDPAYLRDIAEQRAAIFRNQQASRTPAPAPAPAATTQTTSASDPTNSNYWYDILIKNNPGIDPGRARQVATDRAAQFKAAQPVQDILTNIGGSPTAYVPSVLPSAATLAASRFGTTPTAFSSAIDPRQFDAYNRLADRFGAPVEQPYQQSAYAMPQIAAPRFFEKGGQATHFPRKTGPINGPGTGTSDSIPAMLSDGEFVFTAKAVRNAGGGSRRKGAKRMYALMKKLEGGPVKGNA